MSEFTHNHKQIWRTFTICEMVLEVQILDYLISEELNESRYHYQKKMYSNEMYLNKVYLNEKNVIIIDITCTRRGIYVIRVIRTRCNIQT